MPPGNYVVIATVCAAHGWTARELWEHMEFRNRMCSVMMVLLMQSVGARALRDPTNEVRTDAWKVIRGMLAFLCRVPEPLAAAAAAATNKIPIVRMQDIL
jgi:hypothetical protein